MTRRRIIMALWLLACAGLLLWAFRRAEEGSGVGPAARAEAKAKKAQSAARAWDRPAQLAAPAASRAAPARALQRAVAVNDDECRLGAFTGTVFDWGTGRPVAGTELGFEGPEGIESVVTGDDGEFRFEPSAPGSYRLATATKEGYLPFAPGLGESPISVVPIPGVRIDGLTVYLTPALDYLGRVVDADGKAVAGATVELIGADAGEQTLLPIRSSYRSGKDGEFTFHAPDGALLEAKDSAGRHGRARLDGPALISRRLEITLSDRGPESASARGRVVDDRGQGIAGARVQAVDISGPAPSHAAITDDDGAFEIPTEAGSRYRVTARNPGSASATLEAQAGAQDLELVLHPGARLRGRVVDDSGTPVASFHVSVLRGKDALRVEPVTDVSVIAGDGSFEIDELPEGDYRVVAYAYGMARSEPTAAVAKANPPEVRISLSKGATLVGRVVDAESKLPLAYAKVSVETAIGGGSLAQPLLATAITGEDGHFELAGLGPGRCSVIAAAHQHHSRILGGLIALPGASIGPEIIELSPVKGDERPQLELAGIGVALEARASGLTITSVLGGGGAEDAGLATGDVIEAVDGEPTTTLGFEGSMQRIRGPVGTVVSIRIRRADGDPRDVAVTRKPIKI